jgi:hypothetical protein
VTRRGKPQRSGPAPRHPTTPVRRVATSHGTLVRSAVRYARSPWLLAALACVVVAVVASLFPSRPAKVDISASLVRTGRADLTFADRPSDTTSPVCGCLGDAPPGGWRGVVFPARRLSVARTGGRYGFTDVTVFSPDPGQWGYLSNRRGLRAHVLVYALPPRPGALISIPGSRTLKTYLPLGEYTHVRDWFRLRLSGALYIESHSREPVAALSPPARAHTSIDYSTPAAHRQDATLVVRTTYGPPGREPSRDPANDLPMLDILGPDVVLHGEVTGVEEPVGEYVRREPVPASLQDNEISAPADVSGRMLSVGPLDVPDGWRVFAVIHVRRGSFALRTWFTPAGIDPGDPQGQRQLLSSQSAGGLRILAPHAVTQARALSRTFRRIDEHARVRIGDIPVVASSGPRDPEHMTTDALYDQGSEQFDYPPTPPGSGVNVFGRIKDLKLAEAQGALTVGAQARPITAPTPLEIRDLTSAVIPRTPSRVPVRVDRAGADIRVHGRSDVRLQGHALKTQRPLIRRVVSDHWLSLLATVFAALLAAQGLRPARRPT